MAPTITELGRAYLRWTLLDGVGPITFTRLLERFGDVMSLERITAGDLETVRGIGRDKAAAICAQRAALDLEPEIQAAAELGVRILCRADSEYPRGLLEIPDAPIVLYIRGELRPTDHLAVAIVGSRRCTIYGSEQARRFGELLAGAGFTVISGLARGIDAFAHHGAADVGGRTIAVLGGGLDEIYPPENRALAEKILGNGAWISELPLKTSVRRQNFPARNRIIAGLALGTLVIEAAQRSGALITARLANEYNREVFALPGRVQEPMSAGTNGLIRDGAAKLVTCLEDIMDELGEVGAALRSTAEKPAPRAARQLFEADHDPAPALRPVALSAAESRVLAALDGDAQTQDAVARATHLPVGELLAALTALELKGLVRRLPGQLVEKRR